MDRGLHSWLGHAELGADATSSTSGVDANEDASGLRAPLGACRQGERASWSLSVLLVLAGCWTGSSTPPQSPAEPPPAHAAASPPPAPELSPQEKMLHTFSSFADQMCACSDMACAQQVADDMTAFSTEVARSTPTDDSYQLTDEQAGRMAEVGTRMGECMQRALMPAPPSP